MNVVHKDIYIYICMITYKKWEIQMEGQTKIELI